MLKDITKIPHGVYCHDEKFSVCPYWKRHGLVILHRDEKKAEDVAEKLRKQGMAVYETRKCAYADTCSQECWTQNASMCQYTAVECEYLGLMDTENDTLLWDQCKECGIQNEERTCLDF